MTFEEFQGTRFTSLDLASALNEDMGLDTPVPGYVYCGSLFITST